MSIRLRLLIIIGLSLSVLWGMVAVWMLHNLQGKIQTTFDQRLESSARMMAGLTNQMKQYTSISDHPLKPLEYIGKEGLMCEASFVRGEINAEPLVRSMGAADLTQIAPGFSNHEIQGKLWRTFSLTQGPFRIATADRADKRDEMFKEIAMAAAAPFGVALVGSLIILWFGITQGLAPIERVRARLETRAADDNSPLIIDDTPPELSPLTQTIQHLLQRVSDAINRERQFVDNAAHELRTPLTGIKTNLQVLKMAIDDTQSRDVVEQSLQSAGEGVKRLQHMLEQLLLLARLDAHEELSTSSRASIQKATAHAIADLGKQGQGRLRLIEQPAQPDHEMWVHVPEALLVSAFRNLLDNALKYSPACEPVDVSISASNHRVSITVTDRGPGLEPNELALAKDRFWRKTPAIVGSGLGLSIVSAIAQHYHGELRVENGEIIGLKVMLIFEMA